MIHEGVYPRLVFHGTPAQNVQPICERGLMPPKKLRPHCAAWLDDAIWTATDPRTSLGYNANSQMIFACAVLDPAVKGCRTAPEPEDEAEEGPLGDAWVAPKEPSISGAMKKKRERLERLKQKAKGETCMGQQQHRSTRKVAPKPQATANATSHCGDWAVLVRDETLVCPVLNVRLRDRAAAKICSANLNRRSTDHHLRTLAGCVADTQSHWKHDKKVARGRQQRKRDTERRRERDDKRQNLL
jgi:hypothetical protein